LTLVFGENSQVKSRRDLYLSSLLALFALFGLLVDFKPLSSQAAGERSDFVETGLNVDISRMKRFSSFSANTLERDIKDWVSIFAMNPEPQKYENMKIRVQGFYLPNSKGAAAIARYTLNCCAADAQIISISLKEKLNLPADTWLEIEGVLTEIEINGERSIGISVTDFQEIEPLSNPYITYVQKTESFDLKTV
jgi:uncharacterized repeat protein (TIGR03943 family)